MLGLASSGSRGGTGRRNGLKIRRPFWTCRFDSGREHHVLHRLYCNMVSIFLSHNSVDKPFVEKLARDLRRMGVSAWFDGWEIKVGDSLFWKIEEGIRENEFFAIVMSPDAFESEWVKTELSAANAKQLEERKVLILPILFRDCDIPYLLKDRKYADFRKDYQMGLRALAEKLGLQHIDILSEENWRWFARHKKEVDWKTFREREFETLVTSLIDLAIDYNWGTWVGSSKAPFSILLEAFISQEAKASITVRLDGRSYAYKACTKDVGNPAYLSAKDFSLYIGNTVEECKEYVWRYMDNFKRAHGSPLGKPYHSPYRYRNSEERMDMARNVLKAMSWYKGDKLF